MIDETDAAAKVTILYVVYFMVNTSIFNYGHSIVRWFIIRPYFLCSDVMKRQQAPYTPGQQPNVASSLNLKNDATIFRIICV